MKIDIGLEIHIQLNTKTKLWSGASNEFTTKPNTNISSVELGIPGACPVLNEAALQKAIRLAIITNCNINMTNSFDRKHYVYPDLPSGYQITQFKRPFATNGPLIINGNKVIINEMHLESDAGKIVNEDGKICIDYNRVGCPLIEVVTGICFSSSDEVIDFLQYLKRICKYMDISNCDMEKGNMRFDVNISMRENALAPYGMRGEIKNLNSFSAVKAAIELVKNTKFTQSLTTPCTIQYDADINKLSVMREKISASEYGYLEDGNISPVIITTEYINNLKKNMPIHPTTIEENLLKEGIHREVIKTLLDNYELYKFFTSLSNQNIYIANICANIIATYLNVINKLNNIELTKFKKNIEIVVKNFPQKISINNGNYIIKKMIDNLENPNFNLQDEINEYLINDNKDEILSIIKDVIASNHDDWIKYCNGDNKIFNTLLGKVKSQCKNISIPIASTIITDLKSKHN